MTRDFGVGQIAEADRPRRTGRLAGGDDLAVVDRAVVLFGGAARAADALDAIGALLHDAAPAHRDVGIEHGFDDVGAVAGIFLAVGITEEIEATHFVGAIRLAEPRADAAIVDLDVQSLAVMHRGRDRAHRLARRMLAMHAGHRREAWPAVDDIIVDAQPMHVAADRDLVRPDDRHIIFRLAGDDAGVAADAGRRIDHHRPFVGVVVVRRVERRRIGAGLVQAELAFRQVGESETRLQVRCFAFQLEEMLRAQQILLAAGAAERDVVDCPGCIGTAQPIDVEADVAADAAGLHAAIAECRRNGARRLSGPHQDRRLDDELVVGNPHHIAVDDAQDRGHRLRRHAARCPTPVW